VNSQKSETEKLREVTQLLEKLSIKREMRKEDLHRLIMLRKLYIEIQYINNVKMPRLPSKLHDLERSTEEKPDPEILQKLRDAIELEDIE